MMSATQTQMSPQESFSRALIQLGGRYKNINLLTANSVVSAGLGGFARSFPERHFDFGNCLRSMVGATAGFSLRGKLPFICANASQVTGKTWDLIRNFICHANLNVKIVGIDAGVLHGEDGVCYQALEDMGLMASIPNMKVICPADSVETAKAMEAMMLDFGPTYLRLSGLPLPDLYDNSYDFQVGSGHIYKQGSDVCLFAIGTAVHTALDAADILERKGISVMVVNMSTLAPIDSSLVVECAKAVKYVATAEDHQVVGGLGARVSAILAEEYPVKVLKIGVDGFAGSGGADELYRKFGLDGVGIAEKIEEFVG